MRLFGILLIFFLAVAPRAYALVGTASQITVQNGTIALVTPLAVGQGGTGGGTFTIHGVLMGQTTAAFSASAAGTSGQAFISGGAGADGAYGDLGVAHGGTGGTTFTAHGVLMGETASAFVASAAGTSGQAFLSGGAGADGAYGDLGFAHGGTGLTTAADDTTLVSSGAAWVATAIPNCVDTTGNHLNYTAATNAFSCGTSSSGSGVAPVIAFGSNGDITLSQTLFLGIGGGADLTEGTVQTPSPGATYKNLRCVNSTIQGTGGATHDIAITARVGNCGSQSSGSLTCTIVGTAAANQACNDTTNTAAPTVGQCIDFQVVTPSAITNNARINCIVERTA